MTDLRDKVASIIEVFIPRLPRHITSMPKNRAQTRQLRAREKRLAEIDALYREIYAPAIAFKAEHDAMMVGHTAG